MRALIFTEFCATSLSGKGEAPKARNGLGLRLIQQREQDLRLVKGLE
jgi:hypothetical protein